MDNWATSRDGTCEYMVPDAPWYLHRYRCKHKAKYRILEAGEHISDNRHVCGTHKRTMLNRNSDLNVMDLLPPVLKKKRGPKKGYGRCQDEAELIENVWLFYDAGQNMTQLSNHLHVSYTRIAEILDKGRVSE